MRDALQAELGSAITLVIGLEAIMFVAVALSFGSLLPLIKPYIRMSKEEIGRAADLLAQVCTAQTRIRTRTRTASSPVATLPAAL